MLSYDLKIVGKFHVPDDDSEDGRFYRLIAKLWNSLPEGILNRTYFNEGVEVLVRADWESVRSLTFEVDRIAQVSIAAGEDGLFKWLEPFPDEVEIPVFIFVNGESEISSYGWYPSFFAENYLYDVFAILNFSLPGAADFMNLKVQHDMKKSPSSPTRLASYYFYAAYAQHEEWPYLGEVDVQTVENWYSSVRRGVSQIPDSPLERAIFAMLHVCRSDGRPEDVVWIFHALESLLQTRVGENFSALIDRLTLILNPDAKQEAIMKKKSSRNV